jgi:hypothetical protein
MFYFLVALSTFRLNLPFWSLLFDYDKGKEKWTKYVDVGSEQQKILTEFSFTKASFKTSTWLCDMCYLRAACRFTITLVP